MEKYDVRHRYAGDEKLINPREAAEILGCSRITVDRRTFSGDLQAVYTGWGGQRFIYFKSVMDYKNRLEEERAKRGERGPGRMLYYPRRRRRSEPG